MPDADRVASTLAAWGKLTRAATIGPWEKLGFDDIWSQPAGRHVAETMNREADAEFIVTARTAMPRLLAAVDTALKDHRKSTFPAGPPGAGDAYGKHYCAGICYTSIDDQVIYRVWPCQPYQAITTALAGKEAGDGR